MILVSATREQLEGMPTFKTLEEKQAEADAAAAQQQMQQQRGSHTRHDAASGSSTAGPVNYPGWVVSQPEVGFYKTLRCC